MDEEVFANSGLLELYYDKDRIVYLYTDVQGDALEETLYAAYKFSNMPERILSLVNIMLVEQNPEDYTCISAYPIISEYYIKLDVEKGIIELSNKFETKPFYKDKLKKFIEEKDASQSDDFQ